MRETALFRSVRLGVEDPEALREFYLDRLELPVVETGRSGFAATVGASKLEFSPVPSSAPHHFAFNIPRNRLEAATAWLSSRVDLLRHSDGGHVFPFPSWDAQALYAIDPGGNIVEWIARHAVPNESPEDPTDPLFDVSSMLEVSEVGLVTGNVAILTATLRAGLMMRGYRPPSKEFAAIGDERGLFVVVESERPWFPTEIPASPAPVVVEIDGAGLEPRRFAPAGAMLQIQIV